jgi:uncharacterized metal-binding protein
MIYFGKEYNNSTERNRSMSKNEGCACNSAPKLIFACSGAADVGAIADQAARKLTREGAGKMFCLAGIGGRVSGIMASTQAASEILAIDGCPLGCAKNSLEQAGITKYRHLQLSELGFAKGQSPATEENIASVCAAALERLQG